MVNSVFDLTGEVALVVGAAEGGLGECAARALSGHGATVAVADVESRGTELERTASRLAGPVSTHVCDVTDQAAVSHLFDEVAQRHRGINVVVNAAGVMLRKPYHETTVDEFEQVLKVNLTGTWLVGREAGLRMSPQGGGRIVNLSTVYAERVGPVPESAYYASKAGVANVTRALASELGRHHVTVNCLAPGVFYPTTMTAPLADDPQRLAWFRDRTMLGRLGEPERDLAGPLLLLSSAASSYMTGQVIYVDGGWSAW